MNELARRIDQALPQTQCQRCGYPDCASYARAVAEGSAGINQCPPGGEEGVQRLAALTGRPALPLNPQYGVEGPVTVAVIDENWCIGCTLCLKVCPTDAILGAHKRMHTVIESYCTGCELCIPVCPVDCISLDNLSGERTGWAGWSPAQAEQGRQRYQARQRRLVHEKSVHEARLQAKAEAKLADLGAASHITDPDALDKKRAVIEAALARARARREG